MKIFSIVGSTAVGKSSFALALARKILQEKKYSGVDLISVDSRQVYQGLEIISGADLPSDFKPNQFSQLSYPFYTQSGINLHGVSIITPDQEWSVAHFQDLAWEVIELAQKENRLVIMIGGTGLYHDQLVNLNPSLRVKPNEEIRAKAEKLELTELQEWAEEVNPQKFKKMNHSDVNNPRRLVRVIEIGLNQNQDQVASHSLEIEQLYLGLNQELVVIEEKIERRVKERWSGEAINEVKDLKEKYQDWSLPAFSALGISEVSRYLNGLFSKEECLEIWTLHELQYARRQLTWWKKKDLVWFEIDNPEWKEAAFAYILGLC